MQPHQFSTLFSKFHAILRERLAETPPWATKLQQSLEQIQRKVEHMTKNLDAIAADWPTLKAAITSKLQADADKIAELMGELKNLDPDDSRAEEIDGEMKSLLNSLTSTVSSTPAPSTDASATSGANTAGGATAGTGSAGTAGTSGQAAPTANNTSAGGDPASGAASTGGPSAGAGTNADLSGSVSGTTAGKTSG